MLAYKLFGLLAATGAQAVDTLVELDYAKYDGVANDTGVTSWLGMRYAAAPIDDLRFAPPQAPKDEGDDMIAADEVRFRPRQSSGTLNLDTLIVWKDLSFYSWVA